MVAWWIPMAIQAAGTALQSAGGSGQQQQAMPQISFPDQQQLIANPQGGMMGNPGVNPRAIQNKLQMMPPAQPQGPQIYNSGYQGMVPDQKAMLEKAFGNKGSWWK